MSFMESLPRYTVTYCQYGETRQKPTDIWTNIPNPKFKQCRKRGDKCHESAPRSSGKGTESCSDKRLKSKIPDQLAEHIVDICEEYYKE